MIYNVKIENFEGPMDLLLYFIKRDELDIYDIPISNITEKFIDVINQSDKLDIALAGEFIVMASVLMRIKIKMILPTKQNDDLSETIDPRKELMHKLIQYKRFRDAANMLSELRSKRVRYFTRPKLDEKTSDKIPMKYTFIRDVKLFDLAKVFKEVIDKTQGIINLEVNKDLNIKIKMEDILRLFDGEGKLTFKSLMLSTNSRYELILYFLLIMELIKNGICSVNQYITFGKIEFNLLNT